MKKQKAKISRLSRNTKTILYALGLVLLVLLGYLALGCPSLTPKMAFRRAEKANLLGPSTILATEDNPLHIGGHMILAESEQVCMLYSYVDGNSPDSYELYFREKTGDATVLSPIIFLSRADREDPALPIVVFDDFPDAQSARLHIDYKSNYQMGEYYLFRSINCTAQRTNPGYFLFTQPFGEDTYTISEISRCFANNQIYEGTAITVTVSFYNANGTLIAERSIEY